MNSISAMQFAERARASRERVTREILHGLEIRQTLDSLGYVIAPKEEATQEMIHAGLEAAMAGKPEETGETVLRKVYRAMMAKANESVSGETPNQESALKPIASMSADSPPPPDALTERNGE